ncbi:MAG: hypothetical protein ACK4WB_06815 [Desulfatiglandales bacterium]
MTVSEKEGSVSQSLVKTRTYGKVRCHNPSCLDRLSPEPGAKTVKCPKCGMEYRIYWINELVPRIRGPVWEVSKRLAEERLKQLEETKVNL